MPYIIKPIDTNKYKVCKKNNPKKCFSKEPMTQEQAIKQMKAIIINEYLKGGYQTHHLSNLYHQLRTIDYDIDKYLRDVRKQAKKEGYNPKNIHLSDDNKHKIMIYDDNGKISRFGRVNYNDYLIYKHLEKKKLVPIGYADMKRNVFQKSHSKIKGNWKSNPFSPNNLALRILW